MKIIKLRAPNGWRIRIIEDAGLYVVQEESGGVWEDCGEFTSQENAEALFAEINKRLLDTPNWDKQAAYDEAHGTDNGYDAQIEMYRREC